MLVLLFAASFCCSALAQSTNNSGGRLQERMGYPANARLLIIHADDAGMSHAENEATITALENGWVTSSSILVPCPWFPEFAQWAKAHPEMDLGIHLAENSEWTTFRWGPVAPKDQVPSMLDESGYLPLTEDIVAKQARPEEVAIELKAQIEKAKAAGVNITHVDSHMGTLFHTPALFNVYLSTARAVGVPLLLPRTPEGASDAQAPAFLTNEEKYTTLDQVLEIGPGVPPEQWLDTYKKMLTPLKPGVYQLIVHLAFDTAEMRGATADHPNWGAAWRQRDFDMVRSPEFRQFLRDQKFILITWKQVAKALPADYATGGSAH